MTVTSTTRSLLESSPGGVHTIPTGPVFWRVCAEELDDEGVEIGSVGFPAACSREDAFTQLDELRHEPSNARYTDWYVVEFATVSQQRIVTDPRGVRICGHQNGKTTS